MIGLLAVSEFLISPWHHAPTTGFDMDLNNPTRPKLTRDRITAYNFSSNCTRKLPVFPVDTGVNWMSWTSSEHLMCVQFTSCVYRDSCLCSFLTTFSHYSLWISMYPMLLSKPLISILKPQVTYKPITNHQHEVTFLAILISLQ